MTQNDPTRYRAQIIAANAANQDLLELADRYFLESVKSKYSYLFDWCGRPIIQYPSDVVALQEIIWNNRPDLIIETGIAHGGSLVFTSSMMVLLDVAEGFDPRTSPRKVVGVDIEVRPHNASAILNHPLGFKASAIIGSSISDEVVQQLSQISEAHERVMVILDSNHTHEHVLEELRMYSPLVSSGQYLVVLDTSIEWLDNYDFEDRPWSRGNNPATAVASFLKENDLFEVDFELSSKLQVTTAKGGYLRRR